MVRRMMGEDGFDERTETGVRILRYPPCMKEDQVLGHGLGR